MNSTNLSQRGKPLKGLFIAGSDTDVGKTYVACLLAEQLRANGLQVGAYKPVASGVVDIQHSDPHLLWQACGKLGSFASVCPQTFAAPLAPPLAARLINQAVDSSRLRDGLKAWQDLADCVLVEGAGGLLSPVSWQDTNLDLAVDFQLPLVIVTANRLGAVHQTMSALSIAIANGLHVRLVVLNDVHHNDRQMFEDHRALMQAVAAGRMRCELPTVEHLPFRATVRDIAHWQIFSDPHLARHSNDQHGDIGIGETRS